MALKCPLQEVKQKAEMSRDPVEKLLLKLEKLNVFARIYVCVVSAKRLKNKLNDFNYSQLLDVQGQA